MPTIDDCPHTFAELADRELPRRMAELRAAMAAPHRMAEFGQKGVGEKTLLKHFDKSEDFTGCYVFIDHAGKPFYVGISRRLIKRLLEHVKGDDHYTASLAYKIAQASHDHSGTRDEAMSHAPFKAAFDDARQQLTDASVAFIQIDNPLELYLFEAYCAMELNTAKWNTFRTH